MNKSLLLAGFLLPALTATSQISIDQNDFPGADDTALISTSDDLSIDFALTGADVNWVYDNLHISDQRIDTFFNIFDASATYQLIFNNFIFEPDYVSDYYTNLVGFDLGGISGGGVTIEDPVGFVRITSSVVENTGIGMTLNSIEIPMAADTIDTEYEIPFTYGDAWTSNSYIYVDLNPAFNGIFQRYQYRSSEVDGWGQVTTPFGTFDAVRVRSEITYDDSAYIDFGFGGSWIELPTPDEVQYTWWSQNNKVPVLKIVTNIVGANETVTRVEFKDKERNLAGIEETSPFEGVIYPNPANSMVNLSFGENVEQIVVSSINGQIIQTILPNGTTESVDVSEWNSGIYLIEFISSDGVQVAKLIVE